jgi:transposase
LDIEKPCGDTSRWIARTRNHHPRKFIWKNNNLIEYGYNRDKERLEQINLAMFSGKTSGLPVGLQPFPNLSMTAKP